MAQLAFRNAPLAFRNEKGSKPYKMKLTAPSDASNES